MSHATVKAIIIPEIIKMISQKWKVTEEKAMDMFYTSKTIENLSDDETGLYGQSALFILDYFVRRWK